MELDQYIFKKIWNLWSRITLKKENANVIKNTVVLEGIKESLTILARALTGLSVEILPSEREGGCIGNLFFLPIQYSHGNSLEANTNFYKFRILYMYAQTQYGIQWENFGEEKEKSNFQQPIYLFPVICSKLKNEFPNLEEFIDTVINAEILYQKNLNKSETLDLSFLHGKWIENTFFKNKNKTSLPEHKQGKKNEITTELKANPIESVNVHEIDKKAIQDYTLGHNFEKIETAEEFGGNWRDLDGSDDLQIQEEAIRELNLKDMVRSEDPVHSVFQSELILNSNVKESQEIRSDLFFLTYPEWNYKNRKYNLDYCKVFPNIYKEKSADYYINTISKYKNTIRKLKEKVNRIANEMEVIRNESYGDELDTDSCVDYLIDFISKQTPNENIYKSKRKRRREISILILIDVSLSTDGYVENKRILDVEKQSTLIFGEILEESGDRFEVDCFSSRTRNHCDYLTLKGFDEVWSSSKYKVGALEPFGYTRIGPAIRHALNKIQKEKSKLKWILFLSDGKPNDYDRYEGKYGIEDVKQAVKECRKEGVHLFGLAVDKKAKDYLPEMLGSGNYKILPHPDELPNALGDFYLQLLH